MIRLIIDYEKQTLSEIHMKIVRPRWMVCFDCSWLTFLNMLVYFLLCTYICINNIEWIINVPFLLYYTVSPLCTLVRANSPWLHRVLLRSFIDLPLHFQFPTVYALRKKWSFLLRISVGNMSKCAKTADLFLFTEKILKRKLYL